MEDFNLALELQQLEQVHRLYKTSLGKQNKSRAWAVWLLIGGLLAICYRAISCQKRGDDVGVLLLMRLAAEYAEQIRFFADPHTKIKAIRDWWKVYSPLQYDNRLEDIEYRLFSADLSKRKADLYINSRGRRVPEEADFSRDVNSKALLSVLSLYSHPSQNLTRVLFQSDKNNGSYKMYDYKGSDTSEDLALSSTKTILDMADRAINTASYLYQPK